MAHQVQPTRAVIIGGGMAGLFAARVLAEAYGDVIVFERDRLPEAPAIRRGVPQGAHAHALLAGGAIVAETVFPGIIDALLERGAVRGYGRFFSGGGFHAPYRFGGGGVFASRPLIEDVVRQRVLALPNVRIVGETAVRGLVFDSARTRVVGIETLPAGQVHRAGVQASLQPADLVVDASGRGSRMPEWLEQAGFPRPELEVVDVHMGYSSRYYRREAQHLDGDVFANIGATPANRRAAGMLAQEGDRWIVTLAGYFGDYPPADEAGFVEFARSLPAPDVYDLIRDATPLSAPVQYRFPSNQRRHYEKLARFPEGLLVLGDALCSFTPLYGQGMSVAALEASALKECLVADPQPLAGAFFARAGRIVDMAWTISVGTDQKLAGTRPGSVAERLFGWYLDRLQVAARHDAQSALAFLRVSNLLARPRSLLHPSVMLRVLRGNLVERFRRSVAVAPESASS